MCSLLKVKRPVRMRSMKRFQEKLCASDRSGQPDITPRLIEACNLSENTRIEQTHDGSGQPDERNSSTAHTVKEQHAHEVHREIASFNTDNEFNRAVNEEDIDFNIPGLPHSTVKHLHSASVREMIQKIGNHPNRHALQRDLQQSPSFNPFSQESKEMTHMKLGTSNCVNYSIWNPKHSAKYVYHIGTSASSIARAGTSCETDWRRTRNLSTTLDLLSIPNYYKKKGRLHGKKPGDHEYYIANSLKKKCKKFLNIHDRFIRDEKFRKNMFEENCLKYAPILF